MKHIFLAISVLILGTFSAHAATIVQTNSEVWGGAPGVVGGAVNGGDVNYINGVAVPNGTATISAQSSNSYGSNLALSATTADSNYSPIVGQPSSVLVDNDLGPNANNFVGNTFSVTTTPWTFTLTLAANSTGYDINNIRVISGLAQPGADQNYSVTYTTASGTYALGTGPYTFNDTLANYDTLETSLTGLGGASLATGVTSLTFTFNPTYADTLPGFITGAYREVEIFGDATAAAPEPSTYALMGFGLLSLMVMRRLRGTRIV